MYETFVHIVVQFVHVQNSSILNMYRAVFVTTWRIRIYKSVFITCIQNCSTMHTLTFHRLLHFLESDCDVCSVSELLYRTH